MYNLIMFGIALCILPLVICQNKEESCLYNVVTIFSGLIFLFLGGLIVFSHYFGLNVLSSLLFETKDTCFAAIFCFCFAGFSFVLVALGMESVSEYQTMKESHGHGLLFLALTGAGTITLAGILWIVYVQNPKIIDAYLWIINNPIFVVMMFCALGIIFLLVISGPLGISFRLERKVGPYTRIIVNKRRGSIVPFLFMLAVFISGLAGYLIRDHLTFYQGQTASESMAESANILGILYWSIMGQPLFILVVVLVLIGGLAKVVASGKASTLVSNVLILWLPAFTWVLVIIGTIPTPDVIVSVFSDIEFLAYLMYLLIYGTLMIGISGAITVFQGFKSLTEA